jgi:MFS transporter, DHA1 family, tetracycline resistance protein
LRPVRDIRAVPTLFLIVVVDLVGFGLVIPLLPFYAVRFAASPQEVTALVAIYSLAQLMTAPLWGRLSDRVGRRPVLIVSLTASALAYLWLGGATALWMLFAARAFAGACAGNIAAAQAYVADVTRPEERARGMGLIGAAFGLGFMIGPALGGLLAGNDPAAADLETPAWVAAGLSAFALLGVALLLSESLPILSRLIVVNFLVILAFAGMQSVFAIWAMPQLGWGPGQVGYVFAYIGLVSAVLQGGLIGRLTRYFGEERLLLSGLALISAGFLIMPFAHHLPVLGGAVTGLALGTGLVQPAINSLISRRAGPDEQGEIMGVAQSAGSLSRVLGPLAAGSSFAAFGRNSPYFLTAVLVAVTLLLALKLPRGRGAAQLAETAPLRQEGDPAR